MGIEPTTYSLGSCRSTTELRPQTLLFQFLALFWLPDTSTDERISQCGAVRTGRASDRGYFNSPEILACEQADITVTLPKPMTSGAKSEGRFGKQDFVYLASEDVYRCPAGERLSYRFTREEAGRTVHRIGRRRARVVPSKRNARSAASHHAMGA
jgi:hypothetical protein